MHKRPLLLLILLVGLVHSVGARSEPSALEWLERMTLAMQKSRYHGEVAYAEGNQIQSIAVSQAEPGLEHAWPKGDPARTQQRRIASVRRAGADLLSSSIPAAGGWSGELLQRNYQLIDHGDASRYGYELREIELRPRDDKRFGYRVWIDRQTLMPIRWDWYGVQGELTRQLKFTSLTVEPPRSDGADSTAAARADVVEPQPETVELGLGFVMAPNPLEAVSMGDGRSVERFLLSDGLASVSVYRGVDEGAGELQGVHALGPLHVMSQGQGESALLLLGEVPAETLQHLARMVRERL